MKKKTVANLIMVAVILVIAAAGVLGVGFIQGWFDAADSTCATLQDVRGVVDIFREGVSYPVEKDTVLRPGDQLTCQSGATAVICFSDDRITLGENASVAIIEPAADAFSAEVHTGEVFAHCDAGATLHFDGKSIIIRQATVLLSIRSGAQSVSVLRGDVGSASAGQMLQYIGEEESVGTLALESMNDFTIAQIRALNDATLYVTIDDLDRLAAERQQALEALLNNQTPASTESTASTEATEPVQSTTPPVSSTPNPEETKPAQSTTPTETTAPAEVTQPTEATSPPVVAGKCTIAIYCNTILDNMSDLEPGKAEFVPGDGTILVPVTVDFFESETVFDVLKRVCDRGGIQLEYSWTPLYDSYYVEGINNLYEFDCGFESGWMYKVNGWFPNYGCSSYNLKDRDVIVWCYTCKGLGTDVGAPRME